MENDRGLPTVSIAVAVVLLGVTALSYLSRESEAIFHLNELEIGLVAGAFGLLIFGLQGLISVLLEGTRLHLGRVPPRLTNPLSAAIVLFSLVLFVVAITLGYGIYDDWGPIEIGLLAGAGCMVLALLLIFYKEAFVGDEACLDDREDGVPW